MSMDRPFYRENIEKKIYLKWTSYQNKYECSKLDIISYFHRRAYFRPKGTHSCHPKLEGDMLIDSLCHIKDNEKIFTPNRFCMKKLRWFKVKKKKQYFRNP